MLALFYVRIMKYVSEICTNLAIVFRFVYNVTSII